MIAPSARPKLAAKAKLRLDAKTGRHVLLYPEKGLALNPSGAAILGLCDGENTIEQIVEKLRATYTQASPSGSLETDVESFLRALAERGLVEGLAP